MFAHDTAVSSSRLCTSRRPRDVAQLLRVSCCHSAQGHRGSVFPSILEPLLRMKDSIISYLISYWEQSRHFSCLANRMCRLFFSVYTNIKAQMPSEMLPKPKVLSSVFAVM